MSAIFSCREAARLASEALDHPLPVHRRLEMGFHLAVCGACRAYRRQIGSLDRLLRGRELPGPLDAGLSGEARERIRLALRSAR